MLADVRVLLRPLNLEIGRCERARFLVREVPIRHEDVVHLLQAQLRVILQRRPLHLRQVQRGLHCLLSRIRLRLVVHEVKNVLLGGEQIRRNDGVRLPRVVLASELDGLGERLGIRRLHDAVESLDGVGKLGGLGDGSGVVCHCCVVLL